MLILTRIAWSSQTKSLSTNEKSKKRNRRIYIKRKKMIFFCCFFLIIILERERKQGILEPREHTVSSFDGWGPYPLSQVVSSPSPISSFFRTPIEALSLIPEEIIFWVRIFFHPLLLLTIYCNFLSFNYSIKFIVCVRNSDSCFQELCSHCDEKQCLKIWVPHAYQIWTSFRLDMIL